MNEKLCVVATLTSREEKVDDLLPVLKGLVDPTRQEVGCVSYELLQDVEDRTQFTFVEEWADDSSFQSHLRSSHFAAAAARLPDLLAEEPVIRRCRLLA